MSGRTLAELFPVDDDTDLDVEFATKLIREISQRLAALAILREGLEAAIRQAQDIALLRINEILGPARQQVEDMITSLTAMLATAQAALQAATQDALAQIQPQIDEKLAAVDTALTALATAVSNANTAVSGAVSAATAAANAANTAAGTANAAAAGVGAAISTALAETNALMIAYSVAL
jgi:hypothetical protein